MVVRVEEKSKLKINVKKSKRGNTQKKILELALLVVGE
jgi:hypothetical protein